MPSFSFSHPFAAKTKKRAADQLYPILIAGVVLCAFQTGLHARHRSSVFGHVVDGMYAPRFLTDKSHRLFCVKSFVSTATSVRLHVLLQYCVACARKGWLRRSLLVNALAHRAPPFSIFFLLSSSFPRRPAVETYRTCCSTGRRVQGKRRASCVCCGSCTVPASKRYRLVLHTFRSKLYGYFSTLLRFIRTTLHSR